MSLVAVNLDVPDQLVLLDLKVKLVKRDCPETEVSPECEEWQDLPEVQDPRALQANKETADRMVLASKDL